MVKLAASAIENRITAEIVNPRASDAKVLNDAFHLGGTIDVQLEGRVGDLEVGVRNLGILTRGADTVYDVELVEAQNRFHGIAVIG